MASGELFQDNVFLLLRLKDTYKEFKIEGNNSREYLPLRKRLTSPGMPILNQFFFTCLYPGVTVETVMKNTASKNLQKGQKAFIQTSGKNVTKVCVNELSSESESNRHARPSVEQLCEAAQKETKSPCLSLLRTKRHVFAPAILATVLAVIGFCIGIAFIFQGKLSNLTHYTRAQHMNGSLRFQSVYIFTKT